MKKYLLALVVMPTVYSLYAYHEKQDSCCMFYRLSLCDCKDKTICSDNCCCRSMDNDSNDENKN